MASRDGILAGEGVVDFVFVCFALGAGYRHGRLHLTLRARSADHLQLGKLMTWACL